MKMSKQNRNAEKKPLMYIVQADYSDTQSSMQDILIKKRKGCAVQVLAFLVRQPLLLQAEFDILPPAFHASALLPAAEALSFF
jgi:hypothetical protein